VFELKKICKSFGEICVLREINLNIKSGIISGLVGPNGSGKTTLINIMSGLLKSNSGKIILNGRDISRNTPDQIYRFGVSRTFQNIRVFKHMTVLENVISAMIYTDSFNIIELFKQVKKPCKTKKHFAQNMLEKMEIVELSKLFASELPLPMLRRLEIARALANNPKIILLDEPAGGMTPKETEKLATLIIERIAPTRTCIVIEHKLDLIKEVCENLFVLNNGKIISQGNPSLVLEQMAVIEAYIGKA